MKMENIFFVVLFVICLSSCKKGDKTINSKLSPDTTVVDTLLKKDFFFQPGTYWVYSLDSSSIQDCTYVVSSSLQDGEVVIAPGGPGEGPTYWPYKTAKVSLSGTTEPTVYYLTGRWWSFTSPYAFICPDIDAFDCPYFSNKQYLLLYIENGHIVSNNLQHYSSLAIDSVTSYKDVYKMIFVSHENSYSIKDSSYFYINDSIGIVRKDLYQGNGVYKRYYLKRYHIVK